MFESRLTLRWLRSTATLLTVTVCAVVFADHPADPKNGQVYMTGHAVEVWDADGGGWVMPETFWLNYAKRGNGKFWGRTADYPPYKDVNEHDTILIQLKQGVCLMEFFHTRWRRAQDVRRWDTAFNDYGGCPHVFD